jgi:uncharacterized protein YndB with AHSA1/START domain
MPNIHQQLIIGAPAEKVYDAITSREGLSGWWTPGATAMPKLDSIARFPFGQEYFKEMRITELSSTQRVKWICIAGTAEWIGTSISFELQSGKKSQLLNLNPDIEDQIEQQNHDTVTLLNFHHDDWKAYTPMFGECSYTWGQFLRSLKLFCETGKGRPWPHQHSTEP